MRPSFLGRNLKSYHGGLHQRPQGVDGEGEYDDRLRQRHRRVHSRRLFNNVRGKKNVAIIGFTTDGDVFGGFYGVAVTDNTQRSFDPDMFAFSFESHGRCATPQRFKMKEEVKAKPCVCFGTFFSGDFVGFEVLGCMSNFYLGNERSKSFCSYMSFAFEGIEDTTLTGKPGLRTEDSHHCTRLVATQLE